MLQERKADRLLRHILSVVAAVLDDFGYKAKRGAGAGERYLAYKKAMAHFMADCKAKDTLALDAFFVYLSKETKEHKKAA